MRQIKLFKGVETEISTLEAEVNQWIQDNQIKVHKITGNIAPQAWSDKAMQRMTGSDVLIIVEYDR